MQATTPIFSKDEMLFCSVPIPLIDSHKGGSFSFTSDQISKYGQSQTHPSIVYVPGGWNDHEYWLATTPYPSSIGVFENPCIYYGDADGSGNPPRAFTPISGIASGNYTVINNPIVKVPNNATTNSDPDLWYDSTSNLLRLISRENSNSYAVYAQKSINGQAWTPRGDRGTGYLWKKGEGALEVKPEFLSPAIVKLGSEIRIYSLSGSGGIYTLDYELNRGICWGLYVMSGHSFDDPDFNFAGKATILGKRGIEPWHMDMFVDSRTGYIYMICSARNNLTNTTDVYLAESVDGWNFSLFSRPLISGGYNHYRPTAFLRESDNMLVVYFSVVNAPTSADSYPNGASDVPVDRRAIGVCYKNFDDILYGLRSVKITGWI